MEAMSSSKVIADIASSIDSFSAQVSELRAAYEELQAHCPSLASSLRWGDVESYVSAASKSITERFRTLESRARCVQLSAPPYSAAKHDEQQRQMTPRPEIKNLFINMNPSDLRAFLYEHRTELNSLQDELAAALRLAPNPAKIVLDVVEGVNHGNEERVLLARKPCIFMLEMLRILSPEIEPEEKQRAKSLAVEWKNMITSDNDGVQIIRFLQLVGTFKLKSEFDADDILDIIVLGARKTLTLDFCKRVGIDDKYPALIDKLVKKRMNIEAVRYVCALGLMQNIPPVHILEAHIKRFKWVAVNILKKDDSTRSKKRARRVQINAIKEVMRAIEQHKLVCHLTRESLEKQIEEIQGSFECGLSVKKKRMKQAKKRPRLSDLPTANLAAHCPLPSRAPHKRPI